MKDYFIERPIFSEGEFCRRYRMHDHVFNRIMTTLCNHDSYWHQRADVTGELRLLPQQNMTVALRILAYSVVADQCAEIFRLGESTILECMNFFCQ